MHCSLRTPATPYRGVHSFDDRIAPSHKRTHPPSLCAYQNGAGGGGALPETALSFTGAVTIVTLCCCSTMSCVALCLKLVTWMFGHRGRRRILLLPPEERVGEHEEGLCPHPPRTVIVLGTNPSVERDGYDALQHTSEIELRKVPFGNIEAQRTVCNGGGSGVTREAGCANDGGEGERRNGGGSRMKRERKIGSAMTQTGTPSVNGQRERGYYPSSGSSHEADVEGDGEAGDREGDEEEEGEESGKQEKGTEHSRLR